MKKTIFLLLAVMVLGQVAPAQSDYREKRDASGFSAVSFALAGEVVISIGDKYSVELQGRREDLREVITEVSGRRLEIRRERGIRSLMRPVTVLITMPELNGVAIAGSGRITVNDPLAGRDLDVAISGSGSVFIHDPYLEVLTCSIAGSGNLNIAGEGKVQEVVLKVAGSGNFVGKDIVVDNFDARIAGSGRCECHVTGTISAKISGSGNIYYTGNPKIIASVAGSGKIRRR